MLNSVYPDLMMSSLEVLNKQLREVVVKEWKENPTYYDVFLVEYDILEEADKFLQA